MREALALLQGLVDEWSTSTAIPEVDWARMRALDFQDTLRSRNSLVKRLEGRACLLCSEFNDHVSAPGRTCLYIFTLA
jgi:antiviral helicase SKI2